VGHARQWRQWSEEACEQDTGSERMRQKETNREKREGGGARWRAQMKSQVQLSCQVPLRASLGTALSERE
jgi:hypothetical protein